MNRGLWTILIVCISCCVVVIGCNGGDDELAGADDAIEVSEPTNSPSSASSPSPNAPAPNEPVQMAPDATSIPTLLSPANGSSVFLSDMNTFDWESVMGATSYVFVLHHPGGAVTEFPIPGSFGSSADITLSEVGEWKWGVKAVGPAGEGDFSELWTINVVLKIML